MDKVIIDGVDVSGCEFSCENTLNEIKHSCNVRGYEKDNGLHIHLKCKNNPDCYYKQLKRKEQKCNELIDNNFELAQKYTRKEQECEKLKWLLETKCQSELEKENAELKAGNERLKARLRPLEDSYFKGLSSIEIAELAKKSIRITAENRKLEDALQEIRDIAKNEYYAVEPDARYITDKILDKINSVIGAE